MSVPAWARADALMSLLIRRGDTPEFAYEQVERVAFMVESGTDELAAIESVLGFVPHCERERLSQTTSQKEVL